MRIIYMRTNIKTKVASVALTPTEMAAALAKQGHDLSRQQISKDRDRGADMSSAIAFLKWKAANSEREPRKVATDPDLHELKRQKIKKEIAVLEQRFIAEQRDNRIRDGELVERAVVRADQAKIAAKVVAVMMQKFETELPPKQDGLPAAEIAAMNRKALHEIRTILSTPGVYDN